MPLSERQKKILRWAKDILSFAFFIAMILQIRKLMEECPLCATEIITQYGNPLPREEQIRIIKDCLSSYNKINESININITIFNQTD